MRKSCGALLYAFDTNGKIGVILGLEDNHWFVFKGGPEKDENIQTAAIREVYEETGKLVKLESIEITYIRKTNHKEYHIGLCEVSYDIVNLFNTRDKSELDAKYNEKKELKFFTIDEALFCNSVHNITKDTIIRYKDNLLLLDRYKLDLSCKMRRQSVTVAYAEDRYKKLLKCISNNVECSKVECNKVECNKVESCVEYYDELITLQPMKQFIRRKKNNPFRLFNCTSEETIRKSKKMGQPWRLT